MKTLKALAEDALGAMSVILDPFSMVVFQMLPPSIAHSEGNRQHAHEFLDTLPLGHMGIFKLIAPFLQMAEEGLDSPAQAIKFQCFLAMKAVADNGKVGISSFVDTLGGEMQLSSENLVKAIGMRSPAFSTTQPLGAPLTDERVAFDSHDKAQLHQFQPPEPMLSNKLTVHSQHADVFDRQDGKHLLHQSNAVELARVAALGGFGQNPPSDRQADLTDNHGDNEDVDVGLAELPVGAVYGKDPALGRLGDLRKNEGSDLLGAKHDLSEEALEAAENRIALRPGYRMLGKPGQRDGALANDSEHQHRKASEASFVEGEMRLDPIKEGV